MDFLPTIRTASIVSLGLMLDAPFLVASFLLILHMSH